MKKSIYQTQAEAKAAAETAGYCGCLISILILNVVFGALSVNYCLESC